MRLFKRILSTAASIFYRVFNLARKIPSMPSRSTALFILVWSDVLSSIVLKVIHTNGLYLFVCVNFSLLTLLIILKNKPTEVMVDIAWLMLGQMVIHASAWFYIMLIAYPQFYSGATTLIVIITYLRLLWIGKNDGKLFEYPRWLLFCRDYNLVSLFGEGVQK